MYIYIHFMYDDLLPLHREQYSDAKRSRSECEDNYSKDSDSSLPVSQERRLSGFSGGSAVSEAIYSSSPTSTTTPGSTNGNLGYSSATSSGSRIEVTPPGDRGWAAQVRSFSIVCLCCFDSVKCQLIQIFSSVTYTCIHTYMYTHAFTSYTNTYIYVHTYRHMHIYIHTCVHLSIHVNQFTHT